jgi:hypothetical protein
LAWPGSLSSTTERLKIGNENCFVLSKDAEPLLTSQAFYFVNMDLDAIRPLVSERFWTQLSQSPASFDVCRDDDSDGTDDDTLLTMLYENGDRSPARIHDSKPPAPFAAV